MKDNKKQIRAVEEEATTTKKQENTQPNLFESILSGILGPEISSNAEKVIAHFGIPDFFHKHVPGALKGIAKDALAIGTFFYIRNQDRNDAREAVKYLLDVAKAGDQDAQLRLGTSYMRLDQFTQALEWLEKAGEQNNTTALHLAAKCNEFLGRTGEARVCYHKLGQLGNRFGYLGLIDLDRLNKDTFNTILCRAYLNELNAEFRVGVEYMKLQRLAQDKNEQRNLRDFGLFWLKTAAMQGHEEARNLYNKYTQEDKK